MLRILLLVILCVSVVKILTLTLVRVITPVIIETWSLLLASCVEIIPRDLTRGGAWIVPSGLPVERIHRGPVQSVVVALRVVMLIAVLIVTFSIAAKFGTLSSDIFLCRSTLNHFVYGALLLGCPLLLVIRVLQEVGWRLLVIFPGGVADLQLHQLFQEHKGGQSRLGRVVNVLATLNALLLDVIDSVKPTGDI